MRSLLVVSFVALSIASAIACTSSGDDGQSGAADLSAAADSGAPLTPIQAAEKKLVGAWKAQAPGGVTALVFTPAFNGGVNVDRATPMKDPPKDVSAADAFDHAILSGKVLTVDGSGGGTLQLSEFVFEGNTAKKRIESYTFSFGGAAGAETLTLTESSEVFVKPGPSSSDAGPPVVDGGPITLKPPTAFSRVPSFCGGADNANLCFSQFTKQIFSPTIPDVCQGREDVCFTCGSDNRCAVKVPSSCELARFTCVESIEKCEFSDDPNASTVGQATTVDGEGNAIDCNGAPEGHTVCCEIFGNSRAG